MMTEPASFLITLGALLLLGLATDALGRLTRLPRVTLLLIFGIVIGPECLDLLPAEREQWFTIAANLALVMIGFLLGQKFNRKALRQHGRYVVWFSISVVLVTALVVGIGLLLIGAPIEIALLLSGISTATAPAATADVTLEYKAKGSFTDVLLGIVAIDDAWGLMLFSFILAWVGAFVGEGDALAELVSGAWDLGGAVLIGLSIGIPAAYLTGRIQKGEPTLLEALGVVMLCGGLALYFRVSFLIASIVLGMTIANLARHHKRAFHAIEEIERPFMILFFVFAGASLEFESLPKIGLIGMAYVGFRVIGRTAGGLAGQKLSDADPVFGRWMGLALMPQAGVALGMALVTAQQFPELSKTILPTVIGSTVFFELFGPICTRLALASAGNIPKEKP